MLVFYIPAGYYIDMTLWRRRERARIRSRGDWSSAGEPRRRDAHGRPDRRELLPAAPRGLRPGRSSSTPARRPSGSSPPLEATGREVEAILLTHCHFDHIGAVAPVAAATGAPVYCPEIEVPILADIMAFVPWEGFGPYESYDADETVAGGETLELAGLELDVIFTPGPQPRPRHLLGPRRGRDLLRRRPLPGLGRPRRPARRRRADPDRSRSRTLLDSHPDETVVYPGHMGMTTLGAERATNPFLAALAR